MTTRRYRLVRLALASATLLSLGGLGTQLLQALADDADPLAATPGVACDPGSRPENVQGFAEPQEREAGERRKGYDCNVKSVSHIPGAGGFRVERYVDRGGHVCAYYDSTRLFPADLGGQLLLGEGLGVYAVDMTDPARPQVTDTLDTPGMLTPHESLRLNQRRGLLVATAGNPASSPGGTDVYDVTKDCRHPELLASASLPDVFGHESGFAPDGRTYYVSTGGDLSALDLTDPRSPQLVWQRDGYASHGLSVSEDGNLLYVAANGQRKGLLILDVTQVQERRSDPVVNEVSFLSWPEVSIPQNATPFERDGRTYVIETDEYGGGDAPVGAARIIDVEDPSQPRIVSRLRLAVHAQQRSDFTTHYCTVPSRRDPYIIACGFLESGLRVFDIRDLAQPKEVAYSNLLEYPTGLEAITGQPDGVNGSVFSAPAYDPTRNQIWYTDGLRGFHAVQLTPGAGIKRFAKRYELPGS